MKPDAAIVAAVSGYEFGALVGRRWPPISHLVLPLPRPARILLVAAACWWLARHLEAV